MSAVRMRFPAQALEELRKIDPQTAITLPMIRRLVRSGKVPSVAVGNGNRRLLNFDALLDFLAAPAEDKPEQAQGIRPMSQKHDGTRSENATHNIQDKIIIKGECIPPQAADAPTPSRKKIFKPPTLEEVRGYCQERGNSVDPERFLDYYEARGWMLNKTKMKDWKAAVRTWEAKDKLSAPKPQRQRLKWEIDENGEKVPVYAE